MCFNCTSASFSVLRRGSLGFFRGGSGKQARAMNILEDWEEKGERAGIYGKVEGSRSLS